jgi:hypothetical protein
MDKKPMPSSTMAIELGCTCPPIQPLCMSGYYFISLGCPLHGHDGISGGSILPPHLNMVAYYDPKEWGEAYLLSSKGEL